MRTKLLWKLKMILGIFMSWFFSNKLYVYAWLCDATACPFHEIKTFRHHNFHSLIINVDFIFPNISRVYI